jgi:hypothetical protein
VGLLPENKTCHPERSALGPHRADRRRWGRRSEGPALSSPQPRRKHIRSRQRLRASIRGYCLPQQQIPMQRHSSRPDEPQPPPQPLDSNGKTPTREAESPADRLFPFPPRGSRGLMGARPASHSSRLLGPQGQETRWSRRKSLRIEIDTSTHPTTTLTIPSNRSKSLGIKLLPEDIRSTYQIEERHHACAILKLDSAAMSSNRPSKALNYAHPPLWRDATCDWRVM